MHRRIFVISALAGVATNASGQQLGDIFHSLTNGDTQKATPSASGLPSGVSTLEGQNGIRQALSKGAAAAVAQVGRSNGYWGDQKIQIPLPKTFMQLQRTLSPIGLAGPLDDLHLKINRAAETAAPKAKSLFVDAISGMSVDDVVGVLRGGDTAGTQYLRGKTGGHLTTMFQPPIASALSSTGAMQAMDRVVAANGAQALIGNRPKTSLTNFAVAKALDGLFYYVGEEERLIRTNPAKQTTALLRKVFGGL